MRTLNLGILAHVDAGKTSLTERLLYTVGAIDQIGRVDDGNTQTDTMTLERRRGITIKSAVVSFVIDDVTVNLIDTPGHPDFIAEVERVLTVLDGVILVVCAVEGVQAQTRVLMRALHRLGIPTLIFINKLDRRGADPDRTLRDITARLTPDAVDAHDESAMLDVLTRHDEALLRDYLEDQTLTGYERLRASLSEMSRAARVHPVFRGSAVTGTGVDDLVAALPELLPTSAADPTGPPSGVVFKIDRGAAGERISYVRMFAGTLRTRHRVESGKVTAINVYINGAWTPAADVRSGQIGKVWGLAGVRIGDAVGVRPPGMLEHHFAPPTLETVVVAVRPSDRGAMHAALTQLAEQDPLINLRHDDANREIYVSLYGEVQKEVIQATLADDFGVEIGFRDTTTICVERLTGSAAAAEVIVAPTNPFLATVGLRVEPGPLNSGIEFRLEVELGSMPSAFMSAIEETVRETLRQGLYGWQVTDCVVTLIRSGYWARQSSAHGGFDPSMSSKASDFRNLTPLVLMDALKQAGTLVFEPIQRFQLELPADRYGAVLPALARSGAVSDAPTIRGEICAIEGEIPAAHVHELRQLLPALTRGEGVLEATFERYDPVRGALPKRPRSDRNPLNRKEYLLALTRRV